MNKVETASAKLCQQSCHNALHSATGAYVRASELRAKESALAEKISIRRLNFFTGRRRRFGTSTCRSMTAWSPRSSAHRAAARAPCCGAEPVCYDLYPNQRAEGEVVLDGENILAAGLTRTCCAHGVGMVFQSPRPSRCPFTTTSPLASGLYEKLSKSELDGRVSIAARRCAVG